MDLLAAAEHCEPAMEFGDYRPVGRNIVEAYNTFMAVHHRREDQIRARKQKEEAAKRTADFGKTLVLLYLIIRHILNRSFFSCRAIIQ